ncbi:pentapeptide repeat-containing protein [Thalassospira profundimaris]|uniref:pentapeptide repeat-containing protein n=1 Tax=Thalassospira profundimaris TaxID=502049 RepID=UPI00028725D5|nr:pentapeptide repeat-containing protein [Thalassospira profundimaris]EKF07777.1 hypothetical protein TH2_12552 [Thalassospira profundimaris WP0211]
MNRQETLALLKEGKDAWNSWATNILRKRQDLEDAGNWSSTFDENTGAEVAENQKTRKWFEEAKAVFKGFFANEIFEQPVLINGIIFPADVQMENLTYYGDLFLEQCEFFGTLFASNVETRRFTSFKDCVFHKSVHFSGAQFASNCSFQGATFNGRVEFRKAYFGKVAIFDNSTFRGFCDFGSAEFEEGARFKNAVFEEISFFRSTKFRWYSEFTNTEFRAGISFDEAQFSKEVRFNLTQFEKPASFRSSVFKDEVWFQGSQFKKACNFEDATFDGTALFSNARFKEEASFENVNFLNPTSFENSIFDGPASFRYSEIGRKLDLNQTYFTEVPDFRQTHCEEAPLLDNVKIDQRIAEIPAISNGENFSVTAKYRALKRLAIQGHDHKHEVEFFAEELKSRRLMIYTPCDPNWWLSFLFDELSDYGRSIVRPLMYWIGVVMLSAVHYIAMATPLDIVRAEKCFAGAGSQVNTAYQLAFAKGLLVPGLADRTIVTQAYDCLFGDIIPGSATVVASIQTLLSAILLFLLLLGIRNRFKLK